MILEIVNETRRRVPRQAVRAVARVAQHVVSLPPRTQVTLVFVTDRAIRVLNARTRGRDEPTDVLALPLHSSWRRGAAPRDADGLVRLGDVVLSLDTAARQARARGAPPANEVAFLFAHGLLHLLGYDHRTRAEREQMERLAARLCRRA